MARYTCRSRGALGPDPGLGRHPEHRLGAQLDSGLDEGVQDAPAAGYACNAGRADDGRLSGCADDGRLSGRADDGRLSDRADDVRLFPQCGGAATRPVPRAGAGGVSCYGTAVQPQSGPVLSPAAAPFPKKLVDRIEASNLVEMKDRQHGAH